MTSRNGNIFILSSDSLTYRCFNQHFQSVTAQLNPVVFEDAVSTASNTNSAMPALAASVYAESVPNVGLPATGDPIPIAEKLSSAGYQCGLWTDNFLFGKEYNYDRGFDGGIQGDKTFVRKVAALLERYDRLYSIAEWIYSNIIGDWVNKTGGDSAVWRSAETLNSSALNWLDDHTDEDVFCWLHYMDNHHPYMPPHEYLDDASFNHEWTRSELGGFTQTAVYNNGSEASSTELEDLRTAYELTCDYLANELTRFIKSLKAKGHFDASRDTLVITADHGESLPQNSHGELGHSNLWEDTVHVPLLISHPDWKPQQIDGQVSLIDLMPTLLTITGHDVPTSAQGIGYEQPEEMVRDETYFSNGQPWRNIRRGIRTNQEKIFGIRRGEDDVYGEAFTRYKSDEDLEEDIIYQWYYDDDQPSINDSSRTLRERLIEVRGSPIEDRSEFTIDADLEDHLEQLGYIE